MAIVRIMFDPYLIQTIKADFSIEKKKSKLFQPLCSFTNSAMNNELVYIILTAVQQFFKEESDFNDSIVNNKI